MLRPWGLSKASRFTTPEGSCHVLLQLNNDKISQDVDPRVWYPKVCRVAQKLHLSLVSRYQNGPKMALDLLYMGMSKAIPAYTSLLGQYLLTINKKLAMILGHWDLRTCKLLGQGARCCLDWTFLEINEPKHSLQSNLRLRNCNATAMRSSSFLFLIPLRPRGSSTICGDD